MSYCIIVRGVDGELAASARPVEHMSIEAAIAEAERLARKST